MTAPSGSWSGAARPLALPARGEESVSRSAARHGKGRADPRADDDDRQRPLDFRRIVARPEENHRDERGGEAGGERQQKDPLIETDASGPADDRVERGSVGFRALGRSGAHTTILQRLEARSSRSAPASGLRLEAVALEPAIERAAAETERLRRLTAVAGEPRHRLLDQKPFDFLE